MLGIRIHRQNAQFSLSFHLNYGKETPIQTLFGWGGIAPSLSMKLTLQIKLLPTEEQGQALLQTLKEANGVCNRISDVVWDKKVFNQIKCHHLIYHDIKKSSRLSAQAIIRCISKVIDGYKLDRKRKRSFKPLGAIAYDSRILSYNVEKRITSIWSVGGRLKIPFVCCL